MSVLTYRVGRCLLQDLLDNARMTQSELAEKLGMPKQLINKYTKDKQGMSLQTAMNIATVLNCQIEDLYEWIKK